MKHALAAVTILGIIAVFSSAVKMNWEFVLGWFSALPVGIYLGGNKIGNLDD